MSWTARGAGTEPDIGHDGTRSNEVRPAGKGRGNGARQDKSDQGRSGPGQV